MSPRAACRLTQLGFGAVYDYTLGKVDWLAAGLPTEGAGHSPRVLDALVRDVPTCGLDTPAGPAAERARLAGRDRCVVVDDHQIVAGVLRAKRVDAGEQRPAAELMQPGPTTVRAHEDLVATRGRMTEHHVGHLLVTTPDGTLLGILDAADKVDNDDAR